MIPGKICTGFAKFQGIVSVNDFRLPIWLQELLLSCEVCVLHGYDWIHWVTKSCTTTAYRWLFRDSQFSLRSLWSAVIKSPKFSARGTAPPMRLLHGALVILVLWQISQFRSLGKWVSTLCLPQILTSLGCGLQRYFIRRTGMWVSVFRNSFIHKIFSEFLQPLRDFRTQRRSTWVGKQRVSGFYRGFLFIWFYVFLVGLGAPDRFGSKQRVSPFYHLFNIWTWHRHWRGINSTLILSFSSLTVAWCCRRWWRRRAWGRCTMMTLLSWKCHWGWRMRARGRTRWQAWNHDRNEVLRVALYPNLVLMRCGFWPLIHS